MTVHFIGAGPGDPELLSLKAARLISESPVVLYAGSLVPKEVLQHAPKNSEITDTAPLHLDQIMTLISEANQRGHDVARVHSGDPSLYSAVTEQINRLNTLGIPFDITPGIPAFAAAAAKLGQELTLPRIAQTVILTRTATQSSAMPEGEDLDTLARSYATLAIHLSINNLAKVIRALEPHYGSDYPVIIAYRVSWPDELFLHGTLSNIRSKVKQAGITRTALILVGRVFKHPEDATESMLYDVRHHHVLRPLTLDADADANL
ncbi:MAG: precorrin-4 C(11)-methyltransferase [Alphaproteobacteria bacterium]|nr:precorrin-4 C(11)-methyltransferase [Alphaproteobacteria bacterium]